MPTSTYVALATTTLSGDASLTFSSIPASYRDLIMVANFKTSSDSLIFVRANGDTGTNYSQVRMWGTGSSTASSTGSQTYWDMETGLTSSQWNTTIFQIFDYSATDKHKAALYRSNQTLVAASAQRWASTSAITSISIALESGITFEAGTTFSLYGIEA